MTDAAEPLIVIVGGDTLALRVCEELMETRGQRVVVVWHRDDGFGTKVARTGARFARGYPADDDALFAAEIESASSILALTDDDQLNLQVVLRARDLNPRIRVVLRQFNRTLGRKIEQNLVDASVVSLSSHSAATYASAAVDPHCYYGVQFPDIDGPLVGFMRRHAGDFGVAGASVAEAERARAVRILAVGSDDRPAPERVLARDDMLIVFSPVRPARRVLTVAARRERESGGPLVSLGRRIVDAVAGADRVVKTTALVALGTVLLGSWYFGATMHLDPLTAIYFVMATMTTTGYGDITPRESDKFGELASMVLMLSGIVFSGIFIAILTSSFAQIQFRETQGLRPVRKRGHVIVCGSGNVGSRVIEFLSKLDVPIVVVELEPKPDIIARAKAGQFQLLTGDATSDTTLDLCNLGEAEALIALTHSDTLNLEIALGARARNDRLPIVLRVAGGAFAHSVARHFHIYRTHGTAALAGPVFAGLSRFAGVRGRVNVAGHSYAIGEFVQGRTPEGEREGTVPLATWRDGTIGLIASFDDARAGERVLFLYPVWQHRRAQSAAPQREEFVSVALPPHDRVVAAMGAPR